MSVKTVINETYTLLSSIGVVNSKTEFYKDWLNRSESYMRVAKFNNKQLQPTLAVCSSKLKYYADLLKKKDDTQSKCVANEFSTLSEKFDDLIYTHSKGVWIEKMKIEKEKDPKLVFYIEKIRLQKMV